MNTSPFRPEAPGAKSSRTLGILALVSSVLVLCFPLGILFGIIALVKHGKASRLQKASPDQFQPVGSVGMVTGILGLVLAVLVALPAIGVTAAVAVPAYLGYRARASEVAMTAQVKQIKAVALDEAARMQAEGLELDPDALVDRILVKPGMRNLRNPVAPGRPVLVAGEHAVEPGVVTLWIRSDRGEAVLVLQGMVGLRQRDTLSTDLTVLPGRKPQGL